MQDREHLFLFEKRGVEIAQQLGVDDRFTVEELLKPYFGVLYDWLDSYRDNPDLFESIRTEVGVQLDRAINGEPAIVLIGGQPRAYHVPVTVYVRTSETACR
ncbi:hypothetical protein [Fodinicola feengrottensis]|uniref:hypothetical protein n=1 Tax=Fodinicola feengrottensis TaxID=435914 RepID=UPI0024431141|nr:hypothetical protein [Fodinicola feengrottensis]